MKAEQFPKALLESGWDIAPTADGRLRTCSYPANYPTCAVAGSGSLGHEGAKALGLEGDDMVVVLAACNNSGTPDQLRIAEVPKRLHGRVLVVRIALESLAFRR